MVFGLTGNKMGILGIVLVIVGLLNGNAALIFLGIFLYLID